MACQLHYQSNFKKAVSNVMGYLYLTFIGLFCLLLKGGSETNKNICTECISHGYLTADFVFSRKMQGHI